MPYITSTSYKDVFGLYPDGCSTAVSTEAEILLREKVELYDIPPACNENPQPYKWLLKVNDPVKGLLWIDETEESFNEKVATAYCCDGGSLKVEISADMVSTTNYADDTLEVEWVVINQPKKVYAGSQVYIINSGFELSGNKIILINGASWTLGEIILLEK